MYNSPPLAQPTAITLHAVFLGVISQERINDQQTKYVTIMFELPLYKKKPSFKFMYMAITLDLTFPYFLIGKCMLFTGGSQQQHRYTTRLPSGPIIHHPRGYHSVCTSQNIFCGSMQRALHWSSIEISCRLWSLRWNVGSSSSTDRDAESL